MTTDEEIAALRQQLRLTAMLLGQLLGLFRAMNVISERAAEEIVNSYNLGNPVNTEFIDRLRMGLDAAAAPARAATEPRPPKPPPA